VEINLRPVGVVENGITLRIAFDAQSVTSRIIVDKQYSQALDGIEDFSHIVIVFWLDKIDKKKRSVLKVHPRRDPELPLTGVFATRSPARPNPLGLSNVELIKREGNVLTVRGLDAINGTPVLDIKPYLPEKFDKDSVQVAEWVNRNRPQGA